MSTVLVITFAIDLHTAERTLCCVATRLFLVFASASWEGKTIISPINAETLNAEITFLKGLAVQRARVLTFPAHLTGEFGQDCAVAVYCGRCVESQGVLGDCLLSSILSFISLYWIIIIIIIVINIIIIVIIIIDLITCLLTDLLAAIECSLGGSSH
jgi:hypothetical protein